MSYKPTESEYNKGIEIVKAILKSNDDALCRKYVDEVFDIAYSIGSSYNAESITQIAETVIAIYDKRLL